MHRLFLCWQVDELIKHFLFFSNWGKSPVSFYGLSYSLLIFLTLNLPIIQFVSVGWLVLVTLLVLQENAKCMGNFLKLWVFVGSKCGQTFFRSNWANNVWIWLNEWLVNRVLWISISVKLIYLSLWSVSWDIVIWDFWSFKKNVL